MNPPEPEASQAMTPEEVRRRARALLGARADQLSEDLLQTMARLPLARLDQTLRSIRGAMGSEAASWLFQGEDDEDPDEEPDQALRIELD